MKDIDKYVAEKAKEAWEKWRISVDVGDFIRTIVEECKPKVSREFVERFRWKIINNLQTQDTRNWEEIIIDKLKEAGVEVEE